MKFLLMILLVAMMVSACGPRDAGAPAEKTAAAPEVSEECKSNPPTEPMACTMDWNPVCGCDGVTYPNACGAKAAGITEFTEGECAEPRAD